MKPGRELDALIAEKVMGYERIDKITFKTLNGHLVKLLDQPLAHAKVPGCSTDIAAAMSIFDQPYGHDNIFWQKTIQLTRVYSIEDDKCYWQAVIDHQYGATTESAAHSLCLAALRTKGVEV